MDKGSQFALLCYGWSTNHLLTLQWSVTRVARVISSILRKCLDTNIKESKSDLEWSFSCNSTNGSSKPQWHGIIQKHFDCMQTNLTCEMIKCSHLIVHSRRCRWMPCLRHPCLTMNKARIYEQPPFLFLLEITQCFQHRTTETWTW